MNKEITRAKQSKEILELITNIHCSLHQNSTSNLVTHVHHENQSNWFNQIHRKQINTPVERFYGVETSISRFVVFNLQKSLPKCSWGLSFLCGSRSLQLPFNPSLFLPPSLAISRVSAERRVTQQYPAGYNCCTVNPPGRVSHSGQLLDVDGWNDVPGRVVFLHWKYTRPGVLFRG